MRPVEKIINRLTADMEAGKILAVSAPEAEILSDFLDERDRNVLGDITIGISPFRLSYRRVPIRIEHDAVFD